MSNREGKSNPVQKTLFEGMSVQLGAVILAGGISVAAIPFSKQPVDRPRDRIAHETWWRDERTGFTVFHANTTNLFSTGYRNWEFPKRTSRFESMDRNTLFTLVTGVPDGRNSVNHSVTLKLSGHLAEPVFEVDPAADPFGLTDLSGIGSHAFVDIDADGDLDAFVADYSYGIHFFENTGDHSNPVFSEAVERPFGMGFVGVLSNLSFADIDGDGDLDLLHSGPWAGYQVNVKMNIGTATAPEFTYDSEFSGLVGEAPNLVDIDADGDLDAFVGASYAHEGDTYFFRNTGTASSPNFAAPQINPFGLTNVGMDSSPQLVDIDSDGDLDALIGNYEGDLNYFENQGSPSIPAFSSPQVNPFGLQNLGKNNSITFADIDADGDMDAFGGDQEGRSFFIENKSDTSTPDTSPAVCGPINTEKDPVTGKLRIVETFAFDAESGIAEVRFTRLQNLKGYLNEMGPFSQGKTKTYDPTGTPRVDVRGEVKDPDRHGAMVVSVTNGAGLKSACDPVLQSVDAEIPDTYSLEQNYPNPFNPQTTIRFSLSENSPTSLKVYDVIGRVVATLLDGEQAAGVYTITWDGKNDRGQDASSGTYVYRLEAGSYRESRSMTLVR